MVEMPTDGSCDVTVAQLHVSEEPPAAGRTTWSRRASSRAVTHILPKSVAAKCLFCLSVNITSQCRILNKRDLCDKLFVFWLFVCLFGLFFWGGGAFNDTKADNITLPSLFSLWEEIFQRAAMCEFVTVCDSKEY